MENTYFSKVIKSVKGNAEKKTLLYIKSKWADMALEMIIYSTDTNESFKGELTADEMSRIAAELDRPMEQLYDECKEAITDKILTANSFIYRLENEVFRLFKKQTFEIELLEVPLKKLSSPVQILDDAFDEISKLKEKKEANESLVKHEEKSTQETLETLQNCLREKEQIEKTLLRKFLMLLNSKKEEINRLKDQLEANGNHKSRNQKRKKTTPIEEDPDEFDADTEPDEAMEN